MTFADWTCHRRYFSPHRLAGYGLFSIHERRVAGHLYLMCNTALKREWFIKIKDWRQRFTDQTHHAMDEGAFSRIGWRSSIVVFPFRLLKTQRMVSILSAESGRNQAHCRRSCLDHQCNGFPRGVL